MEQRTLFKQNLERENTLLEEPVENAVKNTEKQAAEQIPVAFKYTDSGLAQGSETGKVLEVSQ
ncbi:hypothetical protein [Robinsoniella peoriensis]|uniref:hypothetical protein n=1 Tax=Robinsoniella peoriensis TaxID=180332 RepID=UPI003640CB74